MPGEKWVVDFECGCRFWGGGISALERWGGEGWMVKYTIKSFGFKHNTC